MGDGMNHSNCLKFTVMFGNLLIVVKGPDGEDRSQTLLQVEGECGRDVTVNMMVDAARAASGLSAEAVVMSVTIVPAGGLSCFPQCLSMLPETVSNMPDEKQALN